MAVTYKTFDGKPVSVQWHALLSAARKAGVDFHVNSGHRTFAQQAYLRKLYEQGRGNLAAVPSHGAPHILTGKWWHAIDVNGSQALINWSRSRGVNLVRTVGGESWHLEPRPPWNPAKFPAGPRTLRGGMRGKDVVALVNDLMWLGYLPYPILGRPRSVFGGWVNTAVKEFQRDYHLTVDAVVGDATRRAITQAKIARARQGWKPPKRPPLMLPGAKPKPAPKRPAFRPRIVDASLSVENLFGEIGTPTHLVVHHAAGPRDRDDQHALELLRGYNEQHKKGGQKYGGIGYHGAVTTAGTYIRLRPIGWKGAHAPPNTGRIGVVLLGDYRLQDKPSAAQIQTLRWLLHDGELVGIPNGLVLKGHKDLVGTDCPGRNIEAVLPQIRRVP